MTDHDGTGTGPEHPAPRDPSLEDDITVGAVLDDEATEEERARVLAEPRLRTRLEELRRVRALLGPVDADTGDLPATTAPFTVLDAQRRGASRTDVRRWVAPGRVAAAAVLVLIVLGGALVATRGRDGDSTATSSADTATDAFDRGAAGPGPTGESSDTVMTDAPATAAVPNDPVAGAAPDAARDATGDRMGGGPVDLGEVADAGALAGRSAGLTPGLPPGTPCADQLAARGVTSVATARVDGTDAVVGAGPGGAIVILDRSSCRALGG